MARVASDLCGTGAANYRSTMSYDQYGNITKASSNGTAPVWPQSGSYSSTTNRLSSSTYDANGSTLTDFFHTYQWDGFNRLSTMDSNTMTYDALGKVVEVASGGAYTVFQYTPIGSKIMWNESNVWTRGHLPMPGGTSLDWTPTATYIHHKDWLGSSRLTTVAGAVYTDKAFGAYGEDTAQDFGPATNFNYAGDSQDIATAVYDTPNREYMPYQSRWPNVDPSHHGWNGYAYAGNPLSMIDPSGLEDIGSDDTLDGGISDGEIDATIQETGEGDSIGSDSTEEIDQSLIQEANTIDGGAPTVSGPPSPDNIVVTPDMQTYVFTGQGITDPVDGQLLVSQATVDGNAPSAASNTSGSQGILAAAANVPWSFNFIASTPVEPVGPALTIAYNPKSGMLFLGGGIGVSEGKNASFGPLAAIPGTNPNIDDILSGGSISAGANLPNGAGFQATGNFSGVLAGPTYGVPGLAAQATYSWGFNWGNFVESLEADF